MIPVPHGRKARPTMNSSTEDFPLDYEPTTTIYGRLRQSGRPTVEAMSCSLLMIGMS